MSNPFVEQAHRESLYEQVMPLVNEGRAKEVRRMFDQEGFGPSVIHPVIRHSAIAAAYRRDRATQEEKLDTLFEGGSVFSVMLHMPTMLHAAVRILADRVGEVAYETGAVGASTSASPRAILEARRFASLHS